MTTKFASIPATNNKIEVINDFKIQPMNQDFKVIPIFNDFKIQPMNQHFNNIEDLFNHIEKNNKITVFNIADFLNMFEQLEESEEVDDLIQIRYKNNHIINKIIKVFEALDYKDIDVNDVKYLFKLFDDFDDKHDYLKILQQKHQNLKGLNYELKALDNSIYQYKIYLITMKISIIKGLSEQLGGLVSYAADVDIKNNLTDWLIDDISDIIEDKYDIIDKAYNKAHETLLTLGRYNQNIRHFVRMSARYYKETAELVKDDFNDIKDNKDNLNLLEDYKIIMKDLFNYYSLLNYIDIDNEVLYNINLIYLHNIDNFNQLLDDYIDGFNDPLYYVDELASLADEMIEAFDKDDYDEDEDDYYNDIINMIYYIKYQLYQDYKNALENGYQREEINDKLDLINLSNKISDAFNGVEDFDDINDYFDDVVIGRLSTIYKLKDY